MATVTLKFNDADVAAKKLLEGILATHLFSVKTTEKKQKLSGIEQGIADFKSGKIKVYNNTDELFKRFKNV